jgi:hypothetical protein
VSGMGSITALIADLKLGDPEAVRKIWDRYSAPLASLAQRYLPVWLQRVVDCDDVANSAYRNFVSGVLDGRFARLGDREELWACLACLAVRKAINEAKREARLKRPPHHARVPLDDSLVPTLPATDLAAIAAEQFGVLLERLRVEDELLKTIAIWKFEGHTHREIADRLHCSERRVARKFALIRLILEDLEELI